MRNVSRKEKKFLVDMASAKQLEGLLSQVVPGDLHNGSHGYPVRSLYFDTLHDLSLIHIYTAPTWPKHSMAWCTGQPR